ncbi:MAG: M24 family metallopeptidase [Candidatus Firestonebacteria bacterium]
MFKFNREKEVAVKEKKLYRFMKNNKIDTLLISNLNNFAWITGGGDSHVRMTQAAGVCTAVFTGGKKYIVTSNIEGMRIMEEEVKGLGYILKPHNWWEASKKEEIIKNLIGSGTAASDDGAFGARKVDADLMRLRMVLSNEEVRKYKWLGKKAGKAMSKVCKKIKKGSREDDVSAALAKELFKEGIQPSVLLMAQEDRAVKYRHPISTQASINKYIMVVLCAKKWGLAVSLTRMVCFGEVSPEMKRKHAAVLKVDAVFNLNTKSGLTIGEVFRKGQTAYKEAGFEKEWMLHHQGGPTGYNEREFVGTPDNKEVIQGNMAFAWNPSITGTKCEDTLILRKNGKVEIITPTPKWPMMEIKVGKEKLERPDILVRQ